MEDIIYQMALSMMPIKHELQHALMETVQSAAQLYEYRYHLNELIPEANANANALFAKMDKYVGLARKEYDIAQERNIQVISINSNDYPERMRHESNTPIILYKIGNADLNKRHAISVVGTRRCTPYGRDVCNQFIDELKNLVPDLIVFSGMAYGIDITAHRRCLYHDIPTVGVLAHGLDTIYPTAHRHDAQEICKKDGCLISEYPTNTDINKANFIYRNRIIAACSDATIVVESSEKGGSLHTAEMAQEYNRCVYAFPGRITDKQSFGCLDLVSKNTAALIRSAEQFVKMQGWDNIVRKNNIIQTEIFPELDDITNNIITAMREHDTMSLDKLSDATGLYPMQLQSQLLQMELDNIVELCAGASYRLSNRFRQQLANNI